MIIPFNTHMGSRDGGIYGDIAELEPNANVLDGLAINGEKASDAADSQSGDGRSSGQGQMEENNISSTGAIPQTGMTELVPVAYKSAANSCR